MLEPRFVERASITIAGAAVAGQLGEFNYAEIWEKRYGSLAALLAPHSLDGGCYGATLSEGDHLVYIAGVAVAGQPQLPKGAETRQLPAAKYAVFDCTLSSMGAVMQEIHGRWFHASGLEPDSAAVGFEYYHPRSGAGEMRVELFVPVKPKAPAPPQPGGDTTKVFEAIANRRSIRQFKSDPIPEETLRRILQAGILAPSGKNRQPWRFYVVQGEKRAEMLAHLRAGIENGERQGRDIGSARYTLAAMEQAPVSVFVFNTCGKHPWLERSIDEKFADVVNIQSIGAAIQNMLLVAGELGVGSLWICDIFKAYEELSAWLGEDAEMIAAVSFGFPAEHPIARKRKPFDELVRWV